MTTPVNPTNDPSSQTPPTSPISTSGGGAPSSASFSGGISSIDPTGVWTKFLSTPGHPASPKDVEMFINGLLRTFNIIIQQDALIAQNAAQRMKRAIQGE